MSDRKTVTKAILGYLQSRFSQYAIHIDGGWGQGKTHYINTMLIPYLEGKIKGQEIQLDEDLSLDFKCLYVSLFGLSSKQDIDNAILGTIATAGDSVFSNAFKEIVSKISISESETGAQISGGAVGALMSGVFNVIRNRKLEETENGTVFFFDDLERFNGDMIHPISYISRLVESAGAKCVVLCNQDGFINTEGGDVKRKQFENFKEKVIGRTIKFDLSENEFTQAIERIAGKEDKTPLFKLLSAVMSRELEYKKYSAKKMRMSR